MFLKAKRKHWHHCGGVTYFGHHLPVGAWIEGAGMLLSCTMNDGVEMMIKAGRLVALGSLMIAAGCVPKAEAPAPPPAPVQPRPSPPLPAPPTAAPDWSDIPLTPGTWSYSSDAQGSQAVFGVASNARFTLRCDRQQRRIMLSRDGAATGGQMAVRTSFGARNMAIAVQPQPPAHSSATLAAGDRFLDSLVFSRGRFTIETPGLPMLVIPTWPEPARVVEDCRG